MINGPVAALVSGVILAMAAPSQAADGGREAQRGAPPWEEAVRGAPPWEAAQRRTPPWTGGWRSGAYGADGARSDCPCGVPPVVFRGHWTWWGYPWPPYLPGYWMLPR
jgi:hypothetical protein